MIEEELTAEEHANHAASTLLEEEARRALRFAATQRMKQWKNDNEREAAQKQMQDGHHSSRGPKTSSDKQRIENLNVEARRLERRMQARNISDAIAQQERVKSPFTRLNKLTQPTQATLSRQQAVRETQAQHHTAAVEHMRQTSKSPRVGGVYHVDPSLTRMSGKGRSAAPSSHVSTPSVSLNASLDHYHTAAVSGGLAMNSGSGDAIDQEIQLLQARMRFLDEKKKEAEMRRRQHELACAEATKHPNAEPIQEVYEGGVVKDPFSKRKFVRLFSFRLHGAPATPLLLHQEHQATPLDEEPAHESSESQHRVGGPPLPCPPSSGGNRLRSDAPSSPSVGRGASPPQILPPQLSSNSVPESVQGHPALDQLAAFADDAVTESEGSPHREGSPTSRWLSDSMTRRRSGEQGIHHGPPRMSSEYVDSESHREGDSPRNASSTAPLIGSGLDSDPLLWTQSDVPDVLATSLKSPGLMSVSVPSEPAYRMPTSIAATPTHPMDMHYSLPPALPQTSATPAGSNAGGASTPRVNRRSLVGFAGDDSPSSNNNNTSGLVQSPSRPEDLPRPVRLSSATLLQQQRSLRINDSRSPPQPAEQAPKAIPRPDAVVSGSAIDGTSPTKQLRLSPQRSSGLLEPEASFYQRTPGSGVLGCSPSQARLILAAAQEGDHTADLTVHELSQVAQLVIPADIEASYQLMSEPQRRQLVRRFSTAYLKKHRSGKSSS